MKAFKKRQEEAEFDDEKFKQERLGFGKNINYEKDLPDDLIP